MSDWDAVVAECQIAWRNGLDIDDGCARTIATMYNNGSGQSLAFATTGAITEGSSLLRELFPNLEGDSYEEQLIIRMMGLYLITRRAPRGPVQGWSQRWVGE